MGVAEASEIAAASTALGAVTDESLTAAVETAVAADASIPDDAFTGVVAGSFAEPTTPMVQPDPAPAPAPAPAGGEGDDSAAFNPSLSLLGVAVAAGSLIV